MSRLLSLLAVVSIAVPSLHAQDDHFLGRPAAAWRQELADAKPAVRRGAAFALGRLGGEALGTLPDLTLCLQKDADASVRDMAAAALGDIVRDVPGSRAFWDETGTRAAEVAGGRTGSQGPLQRCLRARLLRPRRGAGPQYPGGGVERCRRFRAAKRGLGLGPARGGSRGGGRGRIRAAGSRTTTPSSGGMPRRHSARLAVPPPSPPSAPCSTWCAARPTTWC